MSSLKESYTLFGRKIRASSIVFPFGVGAMMDMPEGVYMTTSCDNWDSKSLIEIHDERLEKALNVSCFKTPAIKDNNKNIFIPLVQFPEWMFCPKCRRFQSITEWENQYKKLYGSNKEMRYNQCPKCKVKLSPARIITACEDGHIDDFPWIQWVHYRNNMKVCKKPEIYIRTNGVSSGLEGIVVECKTCNIKANLSKIFGKNNNVFEQLEEKAIEQGIFDEKYSLKCSGNMPWDGTHEKCTLYPVALQRGASNVYFPKVESSILIPPYSEKINIKIEQSNEYNKLRNIIDFLKENDNLEGIPSTIKKRSADIAKEIKENNINVVEKIVNRKLNLKNDENKIESKTKYKEEEYKAISGEFGYNIFDQEDFKVEDIQGEKLGKDYIDKVVLIHKMKEVKAFVGFSRINPPDTNLMEIDEKKEKFKLIRPLKEKSWYPAIETKGEGIFIKFDDKLLRKWIDMNPEVQERSGNLNKKYNKILSSKHHAPRYISSKFVFLHTFAHIIIKELSFKCGYSSTSLRERIYCNSYKDDYSMSGVLIYTANGDSEGTLGGLVRQGREDRLPNIIDSAIEKARFCSSDPVCIESKGQGRDALNLSACYSCTLISETSCEEFNTLLDRAMIVGTLNNPFIGFFNYIDANK